MNVHTFYKHLFFLLGDFLLLSFSAETRPCSGYTSLQSSFSVCSIVKADIRNPLRYLLIPVSIPLFRARALEAGNAYLRSIKNRRHCDAFLPTVNRLFFFLFSIFSLCLFRQFFFNRIRQTAKRITTRGIPKHFYSRFCMLFKLMANVDVLCSIAEVVGIKTPVTPSAIRAELNPTMKR